MGGTSSLAIAIAHLEAIKNLALRGVLSGQSTSPIDCSLTHVFQIRIDRMGLPAIRNDANAWGSFQTSIEL
jgi:hypothetical protein